MGEEPKRGFDPPYHDRDTRKGLFQFLPEDDYGSVRADS